ncbi:MAG: hypothetical protein ACK5WZ_15355 [Pseudobdellovibrionaceae bacterium]|jgi:hypothetical protein
MFKKFLVITSSIFLVYCQNKNESSNKDSNPQSPANDVFAELNHIKDECPNLTGTYYQGDNGKISEKRILTFKVEDGLVLEDSGSILKVEGKRIEVNNPVNGSYIGYCASNKIYIDLWEGNTLLGRMSYSLSQDKRSLVHELKTNSSSMENVKEIWNKY